MHTFSCAKQVILQMQAQLFFELKIPLTKFGHLQIQGYSNVTMSSILASCFSSLYLELLCATMQNLEEMTIAAAEGWDPAKEAVDLTRLRAHLTAQLSRVEHKMVALGALASEAPTSQQAGLLCPPQNSLNVSTPLFYRYLNSNHKLFPCRMFVEDFPV